MGNAIFDHADIYGNYTTEAGFGKAFIESAINREDIQLISKCGIQLINERRGSINGRLIASSSYIYIYIYN